jgi:hypothetical protein
MGGKHSRKEPFEQLVNSSSEHLHMSPQQLALIATFSLMWWQIPDPPEAPLGGGGL